VAESIKRNSNIESFIASLFVSLGTTTVFIATTCMATNSVSVGFVTSTRKSSNTMGIASTIVLCVYCMVFAVIFVLLWLQFSVEFGCCSNIKITEGLLFAVLAFFPALFWPFWLLLIVLQAIWNKVRGNR